jgi:starch synthase
MAQRTHPLSVLFFGPELTPLAKAGGLGDVIGALPPALHQLGIDVRVVLPYYGSIPRSRAIHRHTSLTVLFGHRKEPVTVFLTTIPHTAVPVYLLHHRWFNGPSIYLHGRKMLDRKRGIYTRHSKDVERFTFFSRAALEMLPVIHWQPHILHGHDWFFGLVPVWLKTTERHHPFFASMRTVLTIHNLANQGIASPRLIRRSGLQESHFPSIERDAKNRDIDLLAQGILNADQLTTVSPQYAKEILTPTYGEHLHPLLRRRRHALVGILNGIDTRSFHPASDPAISIRYTARTVTSGKARNKQALQRALRLKIDLKIPLFGMVSRIVAQKGFDLLPLAFKPLRHQRFQVVLLGAGDPRLTARLERWAQTFPDRIRLLQIFDEDLARRIYAASDFFLMPSRFEPCGLGQMIAMRYGGIPIVRSTGGLANTVTPAPSRSSLPHQGTGIVFQRATPASLTHALLDACALFQDPKLMHSLIQSNMKKDFSWETSARSYRKLYENLI